MADAPAYIDGDIVVLKSTTTIVAEFIKNQIYRSCDMRLYKASLLNSKEGVISDVTESTFSFSADDGATKYYKLPKSIIDHKVEG